MIDIPALVLVVPSAASLCCVVAQIPRRVNKSWWPGTGMLIAMLVNIVPGAPAGVAFLAVLFLVVTVPIAVARPAHVVSASPMQIHRALSAIVMAILVLWSAAANASPPDVATSPSRMQGMTGMPGVNLDGDAGYLMTALLAMYLIISACLLLHDRHRPALSSSLRAGWRGVLCFGEVGLMGLAVIVMAIM